MSHASPALAFTIPAEPQVLAAARSLAARIGADQAISRAVLNATMREHFAFDKFTDVTADEYFSAESPTRGPDQDEREVAKEFLLDALANGPKAAAKLKSHGEARAISASTLDRARKELGIITAKEGKVWYWSLAPD